MYFDRQTRKTKKIDFHRNSLQFDFYSRLFPQDRNLDGRLAVNQSEKLKIAEDIRSRR